MSDQPLDPQRRRLLGAAAGLAALLCLPRSAWSNVPTSADTQSAAASLSIADFQRMNWQAVAGGQPLLQPPRQARLRLPPRRPRPARHVHAAGGLGRRDARAAPMAKSLDFGTIEPAPRPAPAPPAHRWAQETPHHVARPRPEPPGVLEVGCGDARLVHQLGGRLLKLADELSGREGQRRLWALAQHAHGDVAGMGADIYESLVAAVVAAMAIALTAPDAAMIRLNEQVSKSSPHSPLRSEQTDSSIELIDIGGKVLIEIIITVKTRDGAFAGVIYIADKVRPAKSRPARPGWLARSPGLW